ncbi:hypothetical protein [Acinetobacter indicus]|uniref:hypothetical protein n=1 Tax=Acinetobacter indicus TaxID=756892 RepID=UPI000CEBF19B|nr:hypothetical protein [Acinetobacter indicus]
MNQKLTLAALLAASLAFTACAKKDDNATATTADASAAVASEQISAEQQAAIDAIDQPVLDENNTDVPEEVANALADAATPDSAAAPASEAQ